MNTIEQQIIDFTKTIKPYLLKEGADFDFIEFKNGIVYIKMLGACSGCSSSHITSKYIEDMMVEEIAGIIEVREV